MNQLTVDYEFSTPGQPGLSCWVLHYSLIEQHSSDPNAQEFDYHLDAVLTPDGVDILPGLLPAVCAKLIAHIVEMTDPGRDDL